MLTSVSKIYWGGLFWEVRCWVLAGVDCHALVARSLGMFNKAWPCKGMSLLAVRSITALQGLGWAFEGCLVLSAESLRVWLVVLFISESLRSALRWGLLLNGFLFCSCLCI